VNENKRLRSELDDSSKEFIELKTKASAATRLKEKLNDLETKVFFFSFFGKKIFYLIFEF